MSHPNPNIKATTKSNVLSEVKIRGSNSAIGSTSTDQQTNTTRTWIRVEPHHCHGHGYHRPQSSSRDQPKTTKIWNQNFSCQKVCNPGWVEGGIMISQSPRIESKSSDLPIILIAVVMIMIIITIIASIIIIVIDIFRLIASVASDNNKSMNCITNNECTIRCDQ